MAKPVLGKSLCSYWFFLCQDFALRAVSMEMGQPVFFLFWSKASEFKICHQSSEKTKKNVNIVILHSETTRKS